jgi:hypothetical protein
MGSTSLPLLALPTANTSLIEPGTCSHSKTNLGLLSVKKFLFYLLHRYSLERSPKRSSRARYTQVIISVHFSLYFIPLFLFVRSIAATAYADNSTQYSHMVAAISVVSENQSQLTHAVKAIQNKDRLRDCKTSEEEEGRMNCDMLNRFIVIGGPYFDPNPNLQGNLQEQVCPHICSTKTPFSISVSLPHFYLPQLAFYFRLVGLST